MALITGEIHTSHEVLYMKSCSRSQFLFWKKDAFQNTDFSCLKCQLQGKKNHAAGLQIFSKFQLRREWVSKVNLSSFQLKNFFKFVHV